MLDRPNALGIGFAKAGTSFVADALANHPNVLFPRPGGRPKKATYFFLDPDADETELRHYMDQNFAELDPARHQVAMEWCVSYVGNATALGNIGALLGDDIRILLCYRDPVDAYLSMYKYAMTTNPDDPASRNAPEHMLETDYANYVEGFFYDDQFEQVRDILPRARTLLMRYDTLVREPTRLFQVLFDFLGVPPIEVCAQQSVNRSEAYRSVFLDKCLRKGLTVMFGERRATQYYRSQKDRRPLLVRAVQRLNRRQVQLSASLQSELRAIHAPHLDRFEKMISRELVV